MIKRALLLLLFCWLSGVALAATYTVTNCNDTGAGSLRQAITDAVAGGGNAEIAFDIQLANTVYCSGEYHQGLVTNEAGSNKWFRIIVESAPLPTLEANGIYVRGLTQGREAANTLGPSVEVRGKNRTLNFSGLVITANNCTVEGLVINRFADSYQAGVYIKGGKNNRVRGCYLGVTATGDAAAANWYGVNLRNAAQSNVLGGTATADRNIISGNKSYGILIADTGSNSNEVKGNYIGVGRGGTAGLGNTSHGIFVYIGGHNLIGGAAAGAGNIVANNGGHGVCLTASDGNDVKGNFIGLDKNQGALGNSSDGISVGESRDNLLGPGNLIGNNGQCGVRVHAVSGFTLITRNTMEANAGKGISIESGSNDDIAYPVISTATKTGATTTIIGTGTSGLVIEIFKTEATPGADNQGEGLAYLGSAEVNGGNWMLATNALSIGDKVTATASEITGASGYTSEFAVNRSVTDAPLPPPPYVVRGWPTGVGAPLQPTISVECSSTMETGSVQQAFFIKPPVTYGSTWSDDQKVFYFLPAQALAKNTHYFVWLTEAASDEYGQSITNGDYTFSFTTVSSALSDEVKPRLIRVLPSNGATGESIRPTVALFFNEWMDETSVRGAVTLPSRGAPWSGTFGGNSITYAPAASLEVGVTYEVSISAAATDVSGNPLANPQSWRFTTAADTAPPEVLDAGRIYLTFSEAISPESVRGNITLTANDGSAVAGGVAYYPENNRVVFTPGADLDPGRYVIAAKTGIKDLNGNPLAREFRSLFIVADTAGPVISGVAFDGQKYFADPRVANAISATAEVTADVSDASGLDYSQLRLRLGTRTVTRADLTGPGDVYASGRLSYRILPAIATSDCVVTIEAYDALGNIGTWEGAVTTSSVSAQVELVPGTRAFATPAQFKPRSADNATIVYTLTRSADIDLQIYGADGRVVWGRRYSSGATGGRVGYNEVTWDGRDTSGGNVGNGVYAFRIISGGRVLGTGYIIVLE